MRYEVNAVMPNERAPCQTRARRYAHQLFEVLLVPRRTMEKKGRNKTACKLHAPQNLRPNLKAMQLQSGYIAATEHLSTELAQGHSRNQIRNCMWTRRASAFAGACGKWSRTRGPTERWQCMANVQLKHGLADSWPGAVRTLGTKSPRKNLISHIDASLSRQPLVKGERLVRYEVNAVMVHFQTLCHSGARASAHQLFHSKHSKQHQAQVKRASPTYVGSECCICNLMCRFGQYSLQGHC